MIVFICIQIFLFAAFAVATKMLAENTDIKGLGDGIAGGAAASGLFVGIPVFIAVIKDDFRSRSMQVALGFGIPRSQMVVCRFLETVMVFAEVYVIQMILSFVLGMAFGYDMSLVTNAVVEMWIELIPVISHMAIALLVVYASMNHTLGLIIYIVLELGIVNIIFGLTTLIPFLKDTKINFSDYWVDGIVSNALNQTPGQEAMYLLIATAIYIAVPVIVAAMLFNKKELNA